MPPEADKAFLLGILAGEGYFGADLSYNPDKYKFNVAVTPVCKVQMAERDIEMLEGLRDKFDMGTIHVSAGKEDHHRNMAVWQIYHARQTRKLAKIIDGTDYGLFKQSKKHETFLKWKEIVLAKEPYEHFSDEEEVVELVIKSKQLNDTNRGHSIDKWVSRVRGNDA